MKLLLIKDDGTVDVIEERVYGIVENKRDRVVWENGAMNGIKVNHILVDDSFEVNEGDVIDLDQHIDKLKVQYKSEVNHNVGVACLKGFTSTKTGWDYETEGHDQKNFDRRLGMIREFPAKYPVVPWKCADGVVRDHTPEEFKEVCNELDDFISSKVDAGWGIKIQIKNAKTVDELESINLNVE